jgi:peptidyl-prolyl cis-trans isomerase A (cyclophilin A)
MGNPMNLPRLIIAVLLLLAVFRPQDSSAQIYADVTLGGGVTGTFTITLQNTKAPVTVANFIGLATGQKGWLDLSTGSIRHDPFFNGLIFHRVIAGFVSQTGSRNGNGTDGPGYAFRNEIDPTLSHATPYTVAMANSGPDTNGSQWYITQGNQSSLDGSYSIFGTVTSGQSVCDALNAVPTSSDKPVTPVTISSIVVYGPSLAGFNLNPSGLPKVLNGAPVMKAAGTTYSLGFDHQAYSEYSGYHSVDLASWSSFISNQYFHSAPPAAGDIDVTTLTTGNRHFFRLARVDYSSCFNALTPTSVAGKTLTFPGLFGTSYVTVSIDATGTGGTYQYAFSGYPLNSGSLTAVTHISPFSAYLYVTWDTGIIISFDILNFSTANSGKFTGRTNLPSFPNGISGSFTSSP